MNVQIPETVDLRKYIDTKFFGVRPHIRGRRVPVATVAYNAQTNHWGLAELAENFGLSEAQVLSALLYYEEHKEEIDKQEEDAQQEYETLKKQYGKR